MTLKFLLVLLFICAANARSAPVKPAVLDADSVLSAYPLIDGHNDLPYQLVARYQNDLSKYEFRTNLTSTGIHTDLVRLKQGKLGAQFWAAYVSCTTQYKDAVAATLEQIDVIKRLVEEYPEELEFVTTADGILEAFSKGKIASLIGVEGGHSIDSKISVLRLFYQLGVRYMTLTHTCNTPWGDNSFIDDSTATQKGLTEFGEEVVWEMNRLGMLVDLSHVSKLVMDTAIKISKAPVIFSHSSSYQVYNHNRNVHDDTLLNLKENNGIIMVNFYNSYIGTGDVDVYTVVDHINHIVDVIGHDYVGIGSDYDGVSSTPKDLEDVSKYPNLIDALIETNSTRWTQENLEKLTGRNLIRVLKEVEEVSKELQSSTEPFQDWLDESDFNSTAGEEGWNCRSSFGRALH